MRLINVDTMEMVKTEEMEASPPYCILSHRWESKEVHYEQYSALSEDERTQLKDPQNFNPVSSPGWSKIASACSIVRANSHRWAGAKHFWIDTCCIDKRSSAELQESLNSMFRWYQKAETCIVYLYDVPGDPKTSKDNAFKESEWFERGWTLQELLAPQDVIFYNSSWQKIGTKLESGLIDEISTITGIEHEVLQGKDLEGYSVAQKMSWASCRKTKYPEDRAYSLLGIFNVNIVPIYGEGDRAFLRLQEEIIRNNDDHTIFAWKMDSQRAWGLLARTPDQFRKCTARSAAFGWGGRDPFAMTNRGLSINLELTPWERNTYLAFIDCDAQLGSTYDCEKLDGQEQEDPYGRRLGIFISRLLEDDQYARVCFEGHHGVFFDRNHIYFHCLEGYYPRPMEKKRICVRNGELVKMDLCNGFRILEPHSLADLAAQSAALYPTTPCGTLDISLTSNERFKKIGLGFDFDMNPVCLLLEFTGGDAIPSNTADVDYMRVEEHRAVNDCCEMWCLKGDRRRGLDVTLQRSLGANGPIVRLEKSSNDGQFTWDVTIDMGS